MLSKTIKSMLFSGDVPVELEEKTKYISQLIEYEATIPSMISLLLASARRDNFKDDVIGWVEWAEDTFGYKDSYLHHRHKCGKLLLDIMAVDSVIYQRLLSLDCDKLLTISRLPRKDVPKFLKAYPPEKLNRDEIRAAVCECLGEEPKTGTKKSDKYQPGLWESMDALAENDEHDFQAMAMDEKFNETSARKFAFSSLGMMTACKTYWQSHGSDNVEILAAVEKQLRDDADALAEIRNNQAAQLQAG